MWRQLFTGADNKTYDLGRVLWAKASLAFVFLSGWEILHGGHFDPMAWGGGMAAVLAAGGAALGMKSNTEPNQ